jgi:hypothetical protein
MENEADDFVEIRGAYDSVLRVGTRQIPTGVVVGRPPSEFGAVVASS